ncbi:MAG: helix-turn-helix domain-containing protein [Deltaproteobacteria bacterium]|nr:helix-turn-helix domain-containing protein [Deltaproteobacteria bacterium]
MARPREFEADPVAEALLDAFWQRGFTRTSIADLSAASGLLPGSLYAAFGGKDAMFALVAGRYVAKLRAALAGGGAGIAGLRHVLDAVVRITVGDPDRRGCLLINTIPESAALSPPARAVVERGLGEMRALLRRRLREAGVPRGGDLDRLVALLFAASVAIRVLGRAGHERRLLQDIADGALAAATAAAGIPARRRAR